MLELLFLLLPVAAAYGWYMGRRSAQQNKQDEANRLSRDYVAGVNFLLSNQQDKAVDLFLDMLKEDTGTVEAHLTLGNLFRSRGEVDRAIRIHQTLMDPKERIRFGSDGMSYRQMTLFDDGMFPNGVRQEEKRINKVCIMRNLNGFSN